MPDCAILAIASASPSAAIALLKRLVKDVVLDEHASSVPWTIANKYYTAKVEFLVHSLSSWAAVKHELTAPALLFVWNKGQPYHDQIRQLSQHISLRTVEVALAVRLSSTGSTSPAETEDDQDIDAYLSSKGFEFVDVPDIDPSSFDRTGILGIPRIVDALSTIMWPSMVRHGIMGTAQTTPGTSSQDYHNLTRVVGEKISGHYGDRIQEQLDELERWLDQDDLDVPSSVGGNEAPWSTVVTPGTLSPSSTGFLESSRPPTPRPGFDDDFTSFVSSTPTGSVNIPGASSETLFFPTSLPPRTSTSFSSTFSFGSPSSGWSTSVLDDRGSFDTARLTAGGSYKSLGSVSDFGDPDGESVNVEAFSDCNDMEDEDVPSQAEIAQTLRRIFGAMRQSLSPVRGRGNRDFQAPDALVSQGGQLEVEMKDANLEHLDLQSMFSALQELKEEVSGMPDTERRKAAAMVALGLVYGLDTRYDANDEP